MTRFSTAATDWPVSMAVELETLRAREIQAFSPERWRLVLVRAFFFMALILCQF
ncbi:MAG: hypothetical protein ACPGU7_13045 [Gammaproteobacteria bacterium]